MELTYIEKLRAKFNEVKEGKMPPDIMAMTQLKLHLEGLGEYISPSQGGRFKPFNDASQTVQLIMQVIDGRFERILSELEADEKKKAE